MPDRIEDDEPIEIDPADPFDSDESGGGMQEVAEHEDALLPEEVA